MIELRPITRDEAREYVRANHRHHGPPVGDLWRHAVHDDNGCIDGVGFADAILVAVQLASKFGIMTFR